jgi:hypothetical protein
MENYRIFHWLLTASGPADWLILLVCIYELRQNRVMNQQQPDGSHLRRRTWPWVLAALLATVVAWGPIALLCILAPSVISGTADVPAGQTTVTVSMAASLPYSVAT